MNDYDKFQTEMQAAGWSLDDIEAMWQEHEFQRELEEEERAHYAGLPAADEIDDSVDAMYPTLHLDPQA